MTTRSTKATEAHHTTVHLVLIKLNINLKIRYYDEYLDLREIIINDADDDDNTNNQ